MWIETVCSSLSTVSFLSSTVFPVARLIGPITSDKSHEGVPSEHVNCFSDSSTLSSEVKTVEDLAVRTSCARVDLYSALPSCKNVCSGESEHQDRLASACGAGSLQTGKCTAEIRLTCSIQELFKRALDFWTGM